MKEAELRFFQENCTNPSKCAATFRSKVGAASTSISAAYGVSANVPQKLKNDGDTTLSLAELLCSRAIQCGFALHQKELAKRMKKLSLKESVDQTMTGLGIDTATIEKVVNAALKKRASSSGQTKRKRASSKSSHSTPVRSDANFPSSGARLQASAKETENSEQKCSPASASKRQRQGWQVQKEIQTLMDMREPHFRVKNAVSYPDAFLDCSNNARFAFVVLNTPIVWFETIRLSNPGVHKHPDITLPSDIEYAIALNLKHIFHSSPNFSLPSIAFDELVRAVRIRWAFRDHKDDGEFLPRFHKKSSWIPPPAAPHIEAGLVAGKQELLSQIPYMSPKATTSSNAEIQDHMSIGPAHQYLIDHQLLCCITDKNLGIAVVPVSWYHECMKNHVRSGPYKWCKEPVDINNIHLELLSIDFNCLPDQLHKFILNQTAPTTLPTLYGIPKIHRQPWAIRPIVPAHAWLTANIGKVIDHLLQPLMRAAFPWILESTRQLSVTLFKLREKHLPDTVFFTGDVTAMYTNISQKGILEALRNTFDTFNNYHHFFSSATEVFILEAVAFVNSNCFFQYDSFQFHQQDGIAMGCPCAPVLANIYLGYHELRNDCHLGHSFYRRFIDDIICARQIPKTSVPTVPRRFLYTATAAALDITWNMSRDSCVFLDLCLFLQDGLIQTRLYSKTLNHYQYIPWSSAHPLSVKRGFCKAELLRFLVASSSPSSFADARRLFWHHLHARGYPISVLTSWFKMVTWEQRSVVLVSKKTERLPPLMLPGQYNPVWDFVLVQRIRNAMLEEWSKEALPASLQVRLITSLSRTVSLHDYSRSWNKRILEQYQNQDESESSDD